jgi:choline dehydrogenase-like flavoprotein
MSRLPARIFATDWDVVVIGSGLGGASLAWGLRDSGLRILLVERGGFLPREPHNWDAAEVYDRGRYGAAFGETWMAADGQVVPAHPHHVGGLSKFYGAALLRMRRPDFERNQRDDGVSPAWPLTYQQLEPYYDRAERLYLVHGEAGADPTEPPRSSPFPYPPLPMGEFTAELVERLRELGMHPFPLPEGVDVRPGGACILCPTCDGFPCAVHAKADAETRCVRPAVESGQVELATFAHVTRLVTDDTGDRVVGAEAVIDGAAGMIRGALFVLACGTIRSPALLLRSASRRHPDGLANRSGLVGRGLMAKANTHLLAAHPSRRNHAAFRKTWGLHDHYFPSAPGGPVGAVQAEGVRPMRARSFGLSEAEFLDLAGRGVLLFVMTECLPDPANRVSLAGDGRIHIRFQANQMAAHDRLVEVTAERMAAAGLTTVLDSRATRGTRLGLSHPVGTLRMGDDPSSSVVDRNGRAHELANLYVADGSLFPSQSSVNCGLTIVALALRVADGIRAEARA